MTPLDEQITIKRKVLEFLDKWDNLPENQTSRWIVCESLDERKSIDKDGINSIMYTDCACCFAGAKSEEKMLNEVEGYKGCGCICHERIAKLVGFVEDLVQRADREATHKERMRAIKAFKTTIKSSLDTGNIPTILGADAIESVFKWLYLTNDK